MSRENNEPLLAGPIRVIIFEHDRATREGLAILIEGTPGYRSVGKFRSVEEALASTGAGKPDVLLLDIHLPGMPGSEGIGLLKAKYNSMQILMC